ncbi:MAG TPA: hypothetical protein VIA62_29105 [Thermoanaerobaculia bacterium]|jgi:hypothetical protein|nr:hypothetical protein [Thermoanaerobaculia bacterium]
MKKLSIHLSLLCLLAFLLIPFAGCKKEDEAVDETPAATSETTVETSTSTTTVTSDNGTGMTSGTTDTMSSGSTMTSDATTPPSGK